MEVKKGSSVGVVVDGCALSSAEAIAGNHDLLAEILLRLPPKPLMRFKCVSKRWLSLISASHFCRRHTLRHPTSKVSGIFLRRTPTDFEFVSLTSNHSASPFKSLDFVHAPAPGIKILQSCNGLLLCSTYRKTLSPPTYYVYNPTTKQFSVLPYPATAAEKSVTIFGMNLAFDPTRSPNYSLVCVRSTVESCYRYQIMLYSSEAEKIGAWRPWGSPFVAPHNMRFQGGVYWNGAIHWTSSIGECLCFDVSEERLRNMPRIPPHFGGYFIAAACGDLHLVRTGGSCTAKLWVFRLERDYSRWIVQCQVDLAQIAAAFPEMVRECLHSRNLGFCYAFTLLSIVPAPADDNNEEDSSLLLHIPGGKVIAYRFKD